MTRPVTRANGAVPKPLPEVEVGVPAYMPFSLTPYKNAWEILRDDDITVTQLIAMRRTDGQARALYRLITLPIRSALKNATFVPQNNVEGGEEEAAFMEQMFTLPASAGGMTVPLSKVIAQMLMAVFDGFSAFEMVYWQPKTGPMKGKWTLKKLAHRPAETLSFLIDNNSEYAGLRQRTMWQGQHIDKVLPAEHTVYYAAQEEERAFYGRSYFEAAFKHWEAKFKLYLIAHIAAQRAAVGTRVGKMPRNPNKAEREALVRGLADLGIAQYIVIPEDYTIESLKEFAGFPFLDYINHHNSQMSKSILAAFFDKDQGGSDVKLVDFGQQSDAMFIMMLQTIMAEIEEVINQKIVPRFIDWNFDSGRYPKFQFGPLTEDKKAALLELFKTLAVAGQSLTIRPETLHEIEKQVSEELGLEIDWETVEEEMEEEKLAQAELEAQMAEQQAMGAAPAAGGDGQPPDVDPALLPKGFTLLTAEDAGTVTLTEFAADLLREAYDHVELAQGVPQAGLKRVRTAEGARIFGVPIGTPITRDMEQRTSGQGVKGKPFGGGIRGKQDTGQQTLGGGLGAKAQDPGSVNAKPKMTGANPTRILGHPEQPGVQLLDFGDGTVAIRDAEGRLSPRQKYDIGAFEKLGWQAPKKDQNGEKTENSPEREKKTGKKTT